MPPLPKNPALLQRRNRDVRGASLAAEGTTTRRAPPLPKLGKDQEWHKEIRRYWRDIWHSPMASEYLRTDVRGLVDLMRLEDQYTTQPTKDLAAEIRQQRQAFGLTPLDRRRLSWVIAKDEDAKDKHRPAESAPAPTTTQDMRDVLRVLA